MSRVTSVDGKQVILAEPYQARDSAMVGRDHEMRLLTASWMGDEANPPYTPLLVGEPGVGKNALVYALAKATGKALYIFNGHEDVTADDLSCTVRFADDPSRGRMEYVLSPLASAMIEGEVCLLDEVAKARPQALAALLSVCDERRYLDSTLLGARIFAAPGFRLVAATNTADLHGNAFPEVLRSRMRPTIPVGYPSEADVSGILKRRYETRFNERVATHIDPLLEAFWEQWRQRSPTAPPTPRDAIHIFGLALNLFDAGANTTSFPDALAAAVDGFFGTDVEARR